MAETVAPVLNERPGIAADEFGCVYIATRNVPGGSGLYTVALYKKYPGGSFEEIPIHEEELYLDEDFVNY